MTEREDTKKYKKLVKAEEKRLGRGLTYHEQNVIEDSVMNGMFTDVGVTEVETNDAELQGLRD